MLTVREQQHSFSTHERMFLWKWQPVQQTAQYNHMGYYNM